MSSRFHNKWHRHNHHTTPSNDPRYPDSAHDPIASPEAPFQGSFVVQGVLSASGGSSFARPVSANINFPSTAVVSLTSTAQTTGEFLVVQVNNATRLIRLWNTGSPF